MHYHTLSFIIIIVYYYLLLYINTWIPRRYNTSEEVLFLLTWILSSVCVTRSSGLRNVTRLFNQNCFGSSINRNDINFDKVVSSSLPVLSDRSSRVSKCSTCISTCFLSTYYWLVCMNWWQVMDLSSTLEWTSIRVGPRISGVCGAGAHNGCSNGKDEWIFSGDKR